MKRILFAVLYSMIYGYAASLSFSEMMFEEASSTLKTYQQSRYSHQTMIDEQKGIYNVDCSAFVGYILQKKAPLALEALPIDSGYKRVRAQNFYDYFKALEHTPSAHWIPIEAFSKLERGDVIVWKYDKALQKKDTGHIVIVSENPTREEQNLYRVRVIDASKGKHANDTRAENQDGIGSGDMWFRVDEKDSPIGLYWSSKDKKEAKHAIAMGRVFKSF